MAYLLDSHALVWFLEDNVRLSKKAKSLIEQADDTIYVSVASLWEIAIKYSLGKLTLEDEFSKVFPAQLTLNGFILLPISVQHIQAVESLPFHHRDPFDRMLIAQSKVEGLTLITKDSEFEAYQASIAW